MNSRERVLTALSHKEPDRVPISFGDIVVSSIFDSPPHGYRALCEPWALLTTPSRSWHRTLPRQS